MKSKRLTKNLVLTLLLSVFTLTVGAQDPIVTGYTPTGGTLGVISENYVFLFDGDKNTKWCVTDCTFQGNDRVLVEFYADIPFVPTGYVMTTGNDCAENPGRNPSRWEILAKKNKTDVGWVQLAHVNDDNVLQDVNSQDFEFEIPGQETAFKYFILVIEGVKSGNVFQLAEFQFRGHSHVTDLSTITEDFTVPDGETLTGTLDGTQHPVKISISDGARVTLNGATIHGLNWEICPWAGLTCEGNGIINLAEGTTSEIEGFDYRYSGIFVPAGKMLTIRGDGSLITYSNGVYDNGWVYGVGAGAGIGSGYASPDCGNINIEGGNIRAYGGGGYSGIGGGEERACGNITINGGTIYASGGRKAPGIGSGGSCGNITITSGVSHVTAVSPTGNISIGAGGENYTCGTITIGDVVTGNISQNYFETFPYKIAVYANGGTGEMPEMSFMYNVARNLDNSLFTREDYAFAKWSTEADGGGTTYENGQKVSNLVSEQGTKATLYAQWQKCTMTDNTPYIMTQDRYVPYATYAKTLGSERVGLYQAWMVPFDYTLTAADVEKLTFYKINMIANSPSPSVETTDEMWVFITRLSAGDVLHANIPYVYKPLQAVTDYAFTTADATLKAKNTGVLAKTETMEDIYSFYATYDNTTATTAAPFYYVGTDGNVSYGDAVTVGPLRWIIRKTSKYGNTPQYARRMYFYDGDSSVVDPTGIEAATTEADDGTDNWCTLDGRRLTGKPTKRGVYVNNGKKIVIK